MAIKPNELPGHDIPETAHHANPEKMGAVIENDRPMIKGAGILARARERSETDQFTVTPEMRARYGIGEQESVCWKRNPAVKQWNGVAGNQSLDHWVDTMEGSIVLQDVGNGQKEPVRSGDLLLCKYPSSVDAEFKEIQSEEMERYLYDTQEGDYHGNERFRDGNTNLQAMKEQSRVQNKEANLIGQWEGQSYQNVMHNLGAEKVRAIMAEHRGSRMSVEDMAAERAREYADSRGGGKTISIPSNVRPKNFMGAKK